MTLEEAAPSLKQSLQRLAAEDHLLTSLSTAGIAPPFLKGRREGTGSSTKWTQVLPEKKISRLFIKAN